jgi:endonuclease YncB( thermonuclease family)
MYKGLLRVSGTIDLSQFWPVSGSDADTASVVVDAQSFEFAPDATIPVFRRTRVFEGAEIRGKKLIHSGKVIIRLQGVDAPELHFAAMIPKKNLTANGTKFWQLLGETATVALRAILPKTPSTSSCEVLTRIDKPGDAFDIYGRMAGRLSWNTCFHRTNRSWR